MSKDLTMKEETVRVKGCKKKQVWFSITSVIFYFEDSSARDYRKPYWTVVARDRMRLQDKISSVLSKEHREMIRKRNGIE